MKLLKVSIKNFRSLGEVNIDLEDFPEGLCLVRGKNMDTGGSNGSGKSSFFDAIFWAFTGHYYGRIQGYEISKGTNSLIREGESSVEVEVAFEIGGETHKIKRLFPPMAVWLDGAPVDDSIIIKVLSGVANQGIGGYYFPYGYLGHLFRKTKASLKSLEGFIFSGGGLVFLTFYNVLKMIYNSERARYEKMGDEITAASREVSFLEQAFKSAKDEESRNKKEVQELEEKLTTLQKEKSLLEESKKSLEGEKPDHQSPLVSIEVLEKRRAHAKALVESYEATKSRLLNLISQLRESPGRCPLCGGRLPEHKNILSDLLQDLRSKRNKLYLKSLKKSKERIQELDKEFADRLSRNVVFRSLDEVDAKLHAISGKIEELQKILAKKEKTAEYLLGIAEEKKTQLLFGEKRLSKIKAVKEHIGEKLERIYFWIEWAKERAQLSITEFCKLYEGCINRILSEFHSDVSLRFIFSMEETTRKKGKNVLQAERIVKEAAHRLDVMFYRLGKEIDSSILSSGELQRLNIAG
ncbi:MAG: AAA family ATPase, partial [Candidatus Micrarchaeaceae archaeon]